MASPMTGTPSEETKHKQCQILAMRRDAMSFPQIAKQLGHTSPYVHKLYTKALKDIIKEDVESTRAIELMRLDKLYREATKVLDSFHPMVNSGEVVRDVIDDEIGQPVINPATGNPVMVRLQDVGPRLAAIDRAVRIMDRRARLLGLDAPTRKEISGPDGKPIQTEDVTTGAKTTLREKLIAFMKGDEDGVD